MESKEHINLVNRIVTYMQKIIPEAEHIMIQRDSSGNNSQVRVFGNYIPDVYYCRNECLIIGEAKTLEDFERKHSKEQFEAYISACMLFEGNAKLVVAVPWQLTQTAKNYFKRKKQKDKLTFLIVIINELGKEMLV